MQHWIEPEHVAEATDRVLERALFHPADIADGSQKFDDLVHSIVQLYACGKSRAERGDLILAALDEYMGDLIREEADNVLDEQREDAYLREYNERGY